MAREGFSIEGEVFVIEIELKSVSVLLSKIYDFRKSSAIDMCPSARLRIVALNVSVCAEIVFIYFHTTISSICQVSNLAVYNFAYLYGYVNLYIKVFIIYLYILYNKVFSI